MNKKSTDTELAKRITDEKECLRLATQILETLNLSNDMVDTIYTTLSLVKEFTAIEAAGIRLKEGEDYPYYETKGFPAAFLEVDRYLCSCDHSGEIIRDSECNPYLECMCRNVIFERTDPTLPFFTRFGSFWTNSTTRLLASTTEEGRRVRTLNRCNGEGYESVALIPLRTENDTIGLLQLNDSRKDMFSHEIISFLEQIGAGIGICFAGRRAQEALEKLIHNLGERGKELNCLYGISKLSNREGITLEGILEETVHIVSLAFQYPKNTCVRLVLDGKEFKTDHFVESSWRLASEIRVDGKTVGTIAVYYREERPEMDEGPFLKEERHLIDAVAERLGKIVKRLTTENALRETRDYLESLFNYANAPIIVWDSDTKVTLFNHAFEHLTGYSAHEVIGKKLQLLFPKWSRDRSIASIVKTLKGEHWESVEIPICCKDGTVRVALWNSANIYAKDGRTVKATIAQGQDITDRKKTEERLRESEARYRILTEKVADGIALVQDEEILFVNDSFASMLGYENSDPFIGNKLVDHIEKDFKQYFLSLFEAAKNGSDAVVFNGRAAYRDGRDLWIEAHIDSVKWKGKSAVLCTIRDVTENKLKEIAIREESENLRRENIRLRSSMKERYRFGDIIGKSPVMQEVYEHILKAQASDAGVIIYGESGTGKELVARAIHNLSERRDNSFVAVNCGAIPETLLETEFFGYDKGAFTGANKDKLGFFDLAHEGTLFLDEVGELAPNLQVKLLRAIDGMGYTPIGSEKTRNADVRIIGATNKDLKEQVKQGLMREDFFYRIHIVSIHIPPLRKRKEDIPLLVDYFLKSNCNGGKRSSIPAKIMDVLCNYHWPGNIRELQNALHRYLTVQKLDLLETPETKLHNAIDITVEKTDLESFNFNDVMEKSQRNVIVIALDQTHWHRGKAASILGIDRKTLFRKMKNFGLN